MNINNLFGVKGKVILITGGSRGIGEMMASGFLANGAKVYISSRKIKDCDATAERLSEKYESECISIPADISNLNASFISLIDPTPPRYIIGKLTILLVFSINSRFIPFMVPSLSTELIKISPTPISSNSLI